MRILFIGDIVGKPGRNALKACLPRLVQEHEIDVVIANGENSAGGSGITGVIADELFKNGVHIITLGDHTWDQKEIPSVLEREKRLLRPANYEEDVPGRGSGVFQINGFCPPIAVLNLQGRTFMKEVANPFRVALREVEKLRKETSVIFVDFHAEATSEKIALGRLLDGKVSAVIGTHTHVQTADEEIFPGGTAFMCDAGFTGGHESVIGREIEPVLKRFMTGLPQRFEVACHDIRLKGCLVVVDNETGRAIDIKRISEYVR